MDFQSNFEVVVMMLGYLSPSVLFGILFWKRERWRSGVAGWRRCLWLIGLALGIITSLEVPVFLLGIQFLSDSAKQKWFLNGALETMFLALLIAPIALVLLGFGIGRQRWVGIFSASLTFVGLYVTLMATSY